MKQDLFIRKINAAALLLLFLFGSTPKQLLHDAIANHKDEIVSGKAVSQTMVAKLPIYCHCENSIIESPFIGSASQATISITPVYTIFPYHYTNRYYQLSYSHYHLRGPPALFSPAA